ncbi:SCAN domain-containing 3-like [Paramuricea clavata]|uniref:SCAN domain-containing 3-like n=1 Tax=Paramuricea clavata TaxID=317549 RepID=A0A6S7IW42_PARCT|nr:SCAN domain-containing 3-like [Paramuricea clavata]
MLGVRSGFKAKINEVAPNVFSVHCMIHREALAAKTLPDILKNVMQQVIRMVNHIKSSALNTRLFRKFCRGMDADHINLLYYTEVRWLSCGNMMQRVYELRTEIRDFLQGQKKDDWANLLNDKEWLAKLSYLSDIFERLNTLNRSLQGKGSNIMEFHDKLEGFLGVIDLLIRKVRADRYALFPSLSEFIESENFEVANLKEPIEEHLLSLKSEFDRYFPDIDTEQFALIRNPFDAVENFDDDDEPAEAELIKMRADNCAKDVFSRSPLSTFWCIMRHDYPNLAKIALKKLLPYPSTYLCESSFSTMTAMKTKSRNRLELEHDFRVCVSTTQPEISKLVRDAKNPQDIEFNEIRNISTIDGVSRERNLSSVTMVREATTDPTESVTTGMLLLWGDDSEDAMPQKHSKEADVIAALKFPTRSAERKVAWHKLRLWGNYHNMTVMDVGEGNLVVARKSNGSGHTIAADDFHKAARTEEKPAC